MKTKIFFTMLVVLPLIAGLAGCKSEDETGAKPAKEKLMVVGGNEVTFRANEEGPSSEVNISADCRWTVTVDTGTFGEDHLSVSPKQGNGNGSLVIVSDMNTDANTSRTATITLTSDGGLQQVISVKQTAGDDALNISANKFAFTAEDESNKSLEITSNISWTISRGPNSEWVKFVDKENNPISGGTSGTTSIYVSVDHSQTDIARTGYLVITYSGKNVNVEVNQEGMTNVSLNVPTDDIKWSYTPNESTIRVVSNAEWQAFIPSGATWLQFTNSTSTNNGHNITGVGNGEIRIACEENNTSRDRMSAVVIIAGTKNPQQTAVVVEQVGNTSQQPLETSVSLTSLSTLRESATFLLNVVSEIEVGEFGLVYTTRRTDSLTIANGEVVNLGKGGLSQGAVGELTGLSQGTTYYVRAFLKKITNGEVLYSDVLTITTPVSVTSVGELTSIYVANVSADFRYSFVADEAVTEYGLVYSDSKNTPTASDKVVKVGNGGTTRSVLGSITNIEESTTYYVRAYVISAAGKYVYSPNVVTITTSASASEPGESDNPDPQLSRRR